MTEPVFPSVREYFQYQAREQGRVVTEKLILAAEPGDETAVSIARHLGTEVDHGIMREYGIWAARGEPLEHCDVNGIISRGTARGLNEGAKAPGVVAAAEERRIAQLAGAEKVEAASGGLAAGQKKVPEVGKEGLSNNSIAIIVGAAIVVVSLLVLFMVSGSPIQLIGDSQSSKDSDEKNPEKERAFAASSRCFGAIHETLFDGQFDFWSGESGLCYVDSNVKFKDLVGQTLATSREVDITASSESEQVEEGKETLENTFNGLQLAIPVSQSLYYSGPAGPALSCSFQLAVAHSAVGIGTDTASKMHERSREHGQKFSALAQRYDEISGSLSRSR